MKNTNEKFNPLLTGKQKIDQIKSKIASYRSPEVAKAQVYQMWSDIFEPEDTDL